MYFLHRGFAILVFCILCITVTSTLECPGETPPFIKLPHGEGKGALQFEFDNPAIIEHGDYPPVILLWGVFDFTRGYMRLDIPNPSILVDTPSTLKDVILLSLIFRLPQNSLYVVNYSNNTCTSHPIIPEKEFDFHHQNLFSKFTYRGTESINTLPVRKWSASFPLLGDFVYFERCGGNPLQLQYTSTPQLSNKLVDILRHVYEIISDATQGEYQDMMFTPEKFAKANLESHQKGIEKFAKIMDSAYPSDSPFSTWNPADSKFFERVTSNLPFIQENAEEIIPSIAESSKRPLQRDDVKVQSTTVSSDSAMKEPKRNTRSDVIDQNSKFNYFVSRLAFLNWVSGPVDQLSFVPHGKCTKGERFEFPLPTVTSNNE